ncbi:hypothetical protein CJ030_MR3G005800 [Morella rubra]|uniref:Uncharacterized protein n=1 Tax=Morella rubra TaxID=262757 RepID=A0A6A1W3K1_9ROSI|nr:hypothetical protein CJ030_MR8G020265 [Morella rubra]KAB1219791.1 hypothetical protein CJ030_MR3G005800 [Morella rubra]
MFVWRRFSRRVMRSLSRFWRVLSTHLVKISCPTKLLLIPSEMMGTSAHFAVLESELPRAELPEIPPVGGLVVANVALVNSSDVLEVPPVGGLNVLEISSAGGRDASTPPANDHEASMDSKPLELKEGAGDGSRRIDSAWHSQPEREVGFFDDALHAGARFPLSREQRFSPNRAQAWQEEETDRRGQRLFCTICRQPREYSATALRLSAHCLGRRASTDNVGTEIAEAAHHAIMQSENEISIEVVRTARGEVQTALSSKWFVGFSEGFEVAIKALKEKYIEIDLVGLRPEGFWGGLEVEPETLYPEPMDEPILQGSPAELDTSP